MQREGGIRIKDVAAMAGVSPTTVSHALNGKGRVSEKTRQKVLTVAKSVGYSASFTARNLASRRSGLLAIGVCEIPGMTFTHAYFDYFRQVVQSGVEAAAKLGYAVVLLPQKAWAGPPPGLDLGGAVLVDPTINDPTLAAYRARDIPVVTTGRDLGNPSKWSIDNDNNRATKTALDHLADRGARRVAVIASPPTTSYVHDIKEAYLDWTATRGMESCWCELRGGLSVHDAYAATVRLLDEIEDPPDALIGTLDRLAIGAMIAIQSSGLRVPDDVMIVAYSDSDEAEMASPPLTAVDCRPAEIGELAIQMLVHLIEGTDVRQAPVSVPAMLVERASTARLSVSSPRRRISRVASDASRP
jgi:DNA-binding LacI/PurR family transcriptional regulator